MEMSFRSGDKLRQTLSLADLRDGQIINGRVKKIEDYGLFIEIEGSKLSGLCHKSQVSSHRAALNSVCSFSTKLSDNPNADVNMALHSFREGEAVKAKVLTIDLAKRRLSFGLKPSYFLVEAPAGPLSEESSAEETQPLVVVEEPDIVSESKRHTRSDADDAAPDNLSDESDEEIQIEMLPPSLFTPTAPTHATVAPPPSLKIQGGFQWSRDAAASSDEYDAQPGSSSDESEDREHGGKKKKRRRKEIEQDLTADLHSKAPESNADFERLLLGSPDSSYLWVQYMSFNLQISEVEGAREIGRRAIKTINFREEQEKLNVWIALLNLENIYGTEE